MFIKVEPVLGDNVALFFSSIVPFVVPDIRDCCPVNGRFDLPGGDAVQLTNSIRKLADLDVELLLPGHMGIVRAAEHVKANFRLAHGFFEA